MIGLSSYEHQVIRLLIHDKIGFEREKTFGDLRHGRFRFDFYIKDFNGAPAIIECDGEQHFHYIAHFHKNRLGFAKQLEHDRRKNSYCLANKIPLYRIPYWEFDKIKNTNELFSSEYLVKNRWHNDSLVRKN